MAKSRKKLRSAAKEKAEVKKFFVTVALITVALLVLLFVLFNYL